MNRFFQPADTTRSSIKIRTDQLCEFMNGCIPVNTLKKTSDINCVIVNCCIKYTVALNAVLGHGPFPVLVPGYAECFLPCNTFKAAESIEPVPVSQQLPDRAIIT